jgi:T-complex protein 1 subunit beta
MSSFVGAIAIADLVKTTLGPKGMDKILQSVSSFIFGFSFILNLWLQVGDPNNVRITITNDGATILRSVPVENPAAKVSFFSPIPCPLFSWFVVC